MTILWLEKKRASKTDDTFSNFGLKAKISPSGKAFQINKNLTSSLGEWCLIGYDTELKKLLIKATQHTDFNGKRVEKNKSGNGVVRVNNTFFSLIETYELKGKTLELQWNEAGKYYQEV